jgi:hypothetical protein
MTGRPVDSGVWKPTAGEPAKKLAGPCEVTNLKLASGAGAAYVAFYDGSSAGDATPSNLKWVLDSSTTFGDSDQFDGLVFNKGVWAVCEQGIGLEPAVCIATRKYTV